MDEKLVDQVAQLTGLSEKKVSHVIQKWVVDSGRNPQELSLEDLREVLTHLIQDLFVEVSKGENQYITLAQN